MYIWGNPTALVPVRSGKYNLTELYEGTRCQRIPTSVVTVLRNLAASKGISLSLLRRQRPGIRAQSLRLSEELTLLPLKMQSSPPTLGYVNVHEIHHLSSKNGQCFIAFHCGLELPILWTMETAARHFMETPPAPYIMSMESVWEPKSAVKEDFSRGNV